MKILGFFYVRLVIESVEIGAINMGQKYNCVQLTRSNHSINSVQILWVEFYLIKLNRNWLVCMCVCGEKRPLVTFAPVGLKMFLLFLFFLPLVFFVSSPRDDKSLVNFCSLQLHIIYQTTIIYI